MTLVDTSVWVDHFRKDNVILRELLVNAKVVVHPFIVGELACGNLRNRTEIVQLLSELPQATIAEHSEVLNLVESNKLYGSGMGWIDAHLIASALLSGVTIFTHDKAIAEAISKLEIEFK